MKIAYINPNSTASMTQGIVATARAALPEAQIFGLTNTSAPAAIQGKADGDAALPGLLALLPEARALGADAIVIACFTTRAWPRRGRGPGARCWASGRPAL